MITLTQADFGNASLPSFVVIRQVLHPRTKDKGHEQRLIEISDSSDPREDAQSRSPKLN